jgi:hypothetical protein
MSQKIELPARYYDAIKEQADGYGGIGSGDYEDEDYHPLCAFGMIANACHVKGEEFDSVALAKFFTPQDNDRAVASIRKREGLKWEDRIPFEKWAAEMGLVRGDD